MFGYPYTSGIYLLFFIEGCQAVCFVWSFNRRSAMKAIVRLIGLTCGSSVLPTTVVFFQPCFYNVANLPADESWENSVAIQLGNASAAVHARYAEQIGYNSISRRLGYVPEYRNNPDFTDFKFLLIDPQYYRTPVLPVHSRNIDTTLTSRLSSTQAYSQSYMCFYNQNVVLKRIDPFPNKLSTGRWTRNGTVFDVRWALKQKAVNKFQLKTRLTLV
jgi:hypothetical protein